MPTKIQIAKTVAGFVVGAGASTIAKTIIANNVMPTKKYQVVTVFCAAAVIGLMASDATEKYTHDKIDAIVNAWEKIKAASKN